MEASRRLRNREAFGETPGTCCKITRRALRSARNAALSERTLPKLGFRKNGKIQRTSLISIFPRWCQKGDVEVQVGEASR